MKLIIICQPYGLELYVDLYYFLRYRYVISLPIHVYRLSLVPEYTPEGHNGWELKFTPL